MVDVKSHRKGAFKCQEVGGFCSSCSEIYMIAIYRKMDIHKDRD